MFALGWAVNIFKNIYIINYITADIFVVVFRVQSIKEIVKCIFFLKDNDF